MRRTFFIAGPTATGKSDLAADLARKIGAEIVSADAFQIYRGLDLLTAKPDASTLAKAPHHLIASMPFREEMTQKNFESLRRTLSMKFIRAGSSQSLLAAAGFTSKR